MSFKRRIQPYCSMLFFTVLGTVCFNMIIRIDEYTKEKGIFLDIILLCIFLCKFIYSKKFYFNICLELSGLVPASHSFYALDPFPCIAHLTYSLNTMKLGLFSKSLSK